MASALQDTALHLLESAVRSGDASSRDLAYLTDRVRVEEGRLQVYGTQLECDARGCASPMPSEEPGQLDAAPNELSAPPTRYRRFGDTATKRPASLKA
jgi:hypothetical protein